MDGLVDSLVDLGANAPYRRLKVEGGKTAHERLQGRAAPHQLHQGRIGLHHLHKLLDVCIVAVLYLGTERGELGNARVVHQRKVTAYILVGADRGDFWEIVRRGDLPVVSCHFELGALLVQSLVLADCHLAAFIETEQLLCVHGNRCRHRQE